MSESKENDLEELGRKAAQQVAGVDAVEVRVELGSDTLERPVYHFWFLIDQDSAQQRAGLVRTRLLQRLRDDLVARGYGELPVIQILNKEDWKRRMDA